ncbi:hypothetical protein SDJN03_08601, partial [Cucurbita argyrosperma subsp. sororia]
MEAAATAAALLTKATAFSKEAMVLQWLEFRSCDLKSGGTCGIGFWSDNLKSGGACGLVRCKVKNLTRKTRLVRNDPYRLNQLNAPCSGSSSIFKRCHLFTGLSRKGLDSDSSRSPTSLDFWVVSSLGNPLREPRSLANAGIEGAGILVNKTVLFGLRSVTEKSNCSSRANRYQGPKSLPKASIELLQCKSFGNYSCSFESYRSFAPRAGLTGHSLGSCTTTESVAAPRSVEGARVSEK